MGFTLNNIEYGYLKYLYPVNYNEYDHRRIYLVSNLQTKA